MRHNRAFTLIELLVVIAIISLLVSLLLPSLSKAKDLARSVQCMSTQKNIGLANVLYANEQKGFSVPSGQWSASRCWYGNEEFLSGLGIEAEYSNYYYNNWTHWFWPTAALCPMSNFAAFPHPDRNDYALVPTSWGINCSGLHPNYYYRRTDILNGPGDGSLSSKVFVVDHITIEARTDTVNPARYEARGEFSAGSDLWDASKRVAYRHHGKANAVYHDGHVAPGSPEALYNDADSDTLTRLWDLR